MVIDEHTLKELQEMFKELQDPVEIILITDKERNQEPSEIAIELAKDLMSITDKIKFEIYDANEEKGKELIEKYKLNLDKWGNKKGPIFFFKEKPNIIFFGLPSEQEFPVFLEDLFLLSTKKLDILMSTALKIKKVTRPLDLYIFVTPQCPYCPYMTLASHRFAYLNDKIRGIMIEALEFPEFANAYQVMAVPKNVIRDREKNKDLMIWEGMVPENVFADYIQQALENDV